MSLNKTFVDNCANISEDQAGELIVKCSQKIKEVEKERAEDEKLNAAKEIVKDLNAGYGAIIKQEKAKIAFLLDKIEEIQNS